MSCLGVIGLAGCMGAGKDYFAQILCETIPVTTDILRFRHGVEQAGEAICTLAGLPIPDWDHKTPADRAFLQALGTDTCRAYCPDIWLRVYRRELARLSAFRGGDFVVITPDVRFPDEAAFIAERGVVARLVCDEATLVARLLVRDGSVSSARRRHLSEHALGDEPLWEIENGAGVGRAELIGSAHFLWGELLERQREADHG